MGSCIVHSRKVVYLFEVILSLLALKADINELLRSHRSDVRRDSLYPRDELILWVRNVSGACNLRFVGQLPCHDGGIFGIQSPINSITSAHDGLDMGFVPLFCLFVAVYQIRKVREFRIGRSVDSLCGVASPACARLFTLRRRREIPG
jgi:hypothetical protein